MSNKILNQDNNTLVAIIIGLFVVITVVVATVSMFAPDTLAQRIAACMTQPNMEYRIGSGCLRIAE
jgi:hypothetical protein